MTDRIPKTTFRCLAATAVMASLIAAESAAAADKVRLSGMIESVRDDSLQMKTIDGKEIMVMISPQVKMMGMKPATVADIKPGDFVGVGSEPTASGVNGAVQIVIFPASMKGTGEGDRSWNVRPNGSMTNATVADAVKSVDGPSLTLAYKGGQRKVNIPAGTTILALASATKEDLKPGASLSVQGDTSGDDMVTADTLRVGIGGAIPPR